MIKLWMPSWIQSNFSATKQQQQPSTIHPLATSTAHTWNQAWLNHSSENKYQKERGDYWERDTRRFPSIIPIQSSTFLTLLIKSKCTWNQQRCPLNWKPSPSLPNSILSSTHYRRHQRPWIAISLHRITSLPSDLPSSASTRVRSFVQCVQLRRHVPWVEHDNDVHKWRVLCAV